jgi:CTP:molybdopterin cytidylyltransferase MocA
MTSVLAGLRAAPPAEGYLVCLGDQPRLGAPAIRALLAAFATSDR